MTDIAPISRSEIADRRRQLRRQRRWHFIRSSWRVFALGGLTVGLIWAASQPDWMLRDPSQVIIEGNKFTSADKIRSLLPIHYPQFLLTLQPKAIAQSLESQAPIAEVGVTRRLFPPSLTIRIQERYPVAIVYPNVAPNGASGAADLKPIALLDERGYLIPYEKYIALNRSSQLPTLRVIGIREQEQTQWGALYQQVSRSPVRIEEIDWRDPSNIVLRTELGYVQLGPYDDRFGEQLQVLDQMRHLSQTIHPDQVAYINLRNPDNPTLKLGQPGDLEQPLIQRQPKPDDPDAAPSDSTEPPP